MNIITGFFSFIWFLICLPFLLVKFAITGTYALITGFFGAIINSIRILGSLLSKKERDKMRQRRHLPPTVLMEETAHFSLTLLSIITICVSIIVLLIWSALATVEETAMTTGQLIPSSEVKILQHLEGGIVKVLNVKDGQHVNRGDLLMEMESQHALSELKQMHSRRLTLLLDLKRLNAFINEEKPEIEKWINLIMEEEAKHVADPEELRENLKEEIAQLAIQMKARDEQVSILKSQLLQRKEELEQITKQQSVMKEHLSLLGKEKSIYDDLKEKMPISKRDYLNLQQKINKSKGELTKLLGQETQAKEAILENQSRLRELKTTLYEEAAEKKGNLESELLEVRHAIARANDRVTRLKIYAPVTGIVQELDIAPGSVVQPGGLLMRVVPTEDELVVQSKLSVNDVGHVKIGDPVKARILAYDASRYGSVKGVVTSISPSTFVDKKRDEPYYEAIIELEKQYVGKNENKNRLLPGMTVEASIITGKKSILSYLVKPIHSTISSSFGER